MSDNSHDLCVVSELSETAKQASYNDIKRDLDRLGVLGQYMRLASEGEEGYSAEKALALAAYELKKHDLTWEDVFETIRSKAANKAFANAPRQDVHLKPEEVKSFRDRIAKAAPLQNKNQWVTDFLASIDLKLSKYPYLTMKQMSRLHSVFQQLRI